MSIPSDCFLCGGSPNDCDCGGEGSDPWADQAPDAPLTEKEKEAYDLLMNAPPGFQALVRTTFQGRGVAVVVGLTTTHGGDAMMVPLAMILDATALAEMEPPA